MDNRTNDSKIEDIEKSIESVKHAPYDAKVKKGMLKSLEEQRKSLYVELAKGAFPTEAERAIDWINKTHKGDLRDAMVKKVAEYERDEIAKAIDPIIARRQTIQKAVRQEPGYCLIQKTIALLKDGSIGEQDAREIIFEQIESDPRLSS